MTRSSSDHAVFSRVYKNYKSFLVVDTYIILMATHNRIFFEKLIQEYDTLFGYTPQEGPKINLLNITMIQSEHRISIDQTDHIINNIIQEYWGTKTNYEVKFQRSYFPVGTSFEKELF